MAEHAEKSEKIDYAALAKRTVDQGLTPTPPGTLYFTFKRTDGDTFVAPAGNAEGYLRKGYTIAGEVEIEDIVSWNAEQSAEAASAPAAHGAHSSHAKSETG